MRLHTPLHILLEEMSPRSIRTAEQSLHSELLNEMYSCPRAVEVFTKMRLPRPIPKSSTEKSICDIQHLQNKDCSNVERSEVKGLK